MARGSASVRCATASASSGPAASASNTPSLQPTMSVRASIMAVIDSRSGVGSAPVARNTRSSRPSGTTPTLILSPPQTGFQAQMRAAP